MKKGKKYKVQAGQGDPIISFRPPKLSEEEIELERQRILADDIANGRIPNPSLPTSTYQPSPFPGVKKDAADYTPMSVLYPQKTTQKAEDFTPPFQLLNGLALEATAVANKFNDIKNDKRNRQIQIDALQNRVYSNADEDGINHDPIYYKAGGAPSETIEAEEGEVFQTEDGTITKVPEGAGTHEQGGVDLHNVHRVLEDTSDKRKDKASKLLKLPPDVVQGLLGFKPKTSLSHSKAHEKAVEFVGNKAKAITGKLVKNAETREENDNDPYAANSIKFNLMNLGTLPAEEEMFNTLFNHQEMVKSIFGISDDGKTKKTGGYVIKAQAGTSEGDPWSVWPGDKLPTFKKKFGVSNAADKITNLDEVAKQLNYTGSKDPIEFQKWLYNSSPENAAIIDKWHQKYEDPSIAVPLSDRNRFDGKIGIRWQSAINEILQPKMNISFTPPKNEEIAPPVEDTPTVTKPVDTPPVVTPTAQPVNKFNEPLKWYDVAGDLSDYATAREEHVNYNPAEVQQIRLHRQNPLPSLQQGQSDYNQMISALASTGINGGVMLGNTGNITAKKYAITNQTLGQYENVNSDIADKESMYNAGAKDRQSILDQQAREIFERKVLGTREAVRQQKSISRNNLLKTVALNKKFNKEGNLLMKLFPAYNQTGDYNGYKYNFRNPIASSSTGAQGGNTFDNFLIQNNINPASLTPAQKSALVLKYMKQTK